jgi:hypothetical protein
MTGELKSMFEAHLTENSPADIAEKQRLELEQQKKKEFYKKQSNIIPFN